MNFDHNKGIQTISYNHLNLPQLITMESGKGTIEYTYDATGNKLQKKVTDNPGNKITITKYAAAFVYTSSYPINGTPTPDVPELISHEEGKVRPKPIDATQPLSLANIQYVYDYFLKDHLGNVRMVITAEQQTDLYAGTMETASAAKEEQLFKNVAETRTAKPGGFDSDNSNGQVARLNGNINTTGNKRVGPAIVLKVMAGDTISISTNAWYQGSTQQPPSGLAPIADEVLSQLTNGVMAANGGKGGVFSQSDVNSLLSPVVADYLQHTQDPNYNSSNPKAFLNWMIADEEFKKVSSDNHMGVVQVPAISGDMQKQPLIGPTSMVVRRNGWLYVYVSNESNQDVYFDDIVVNHKRGPVVEQTDYYPFGTSIAGLGTKAIGFAEGNNRYKYNGKETQSKEFSDGCGLEWYDYGARMYDGQIGRWNSIDPKSDEAHHVSPYAYVSNDPIILIDPYGTTAYYTMNGTYLGDNGDGIDQVRAVQDGGWKQIENDKDGKVRYSITRKKAQDLRDNQGKTITNKQFLDLAGTLYAEASKGESGNWAESAAIYSVLENRGNEDGESTYEEAQSGGVHGWNHRGDINSKNASKSDVQNAFTGLIRGILDAKDYSGGAFWWDGKDYETTPRYTEGTKFSAPNHNIWNLKDHSIAGKNIYGSWQSKFETTAALGHTTFSRLTEEYKSTRYRPGTKVNWDGTKNKK